MAKSCAFRAGVFGAYLIDGCRKCTNYGLCKPVGKIGGDATFLPPPPENAM